MYVRYFLKKLLFIYFFIFSKYKKAGLNVSEYTDDVDTISRKSKTTRIVEGLRDMVSIASGLYVSFKVSKI